MSAEERRLAVEVERLVREWKHREAIPLAERLLALREEALGAEHPAVASALHTLGSLHRRRYELHRALPLIERALAIRQGLGDDGSLDTAATLLELGAIHRDQSRFALAAPALEQALAIREAHLGAAHPDVARALCELGRLRVRAGAPAEARPLIERAIAIWDKTLGAGSLDAAEARSDLAFLHFTTGSPEEQRGAKQLMEQAHATLERKLGARHAIVAWTRARIGWIEYQHRDFDASERSFEAGLQVLRDELGEARNLPWAAWAPFLADLRGFRGDFAGSLAILSRVLELCRDPRSSDPLSCATAHVSLGHLRSFTGDYVRADSAFQEALRVQVAAGGPAHRHAVNTLELLANLRYARADCDGARRLLEQVVASGVSAAGHGSVQRAVTQMSLGHAHRRCRDLESAEAAYRRSLALAEATPNIGGPMLVPFIHLGMSRTRLALGRVAEARDLLEQASGAAERVYPTGTAPNLETNALLLEAQIRGYEGDAGAAEIAARRALAIVEQRLGADSPEAIDPLGALTRSLLAQGRIAESLDAAERAARIQDDHAALILSAGAEEERRTFMASLRDSTDLAIHLHARAGAAHERAAQLALSVVLRRKARVLDAMADTFAALRARVAPADAALLDRHRDLQRRLAAMYARGPGAAPRDQHAARLRALDDERRAVEAELSRRCPELGEERRLVTIEDVRAALPEDAVLIDIIIHRPLNEQARRPAEGWLEPRYAAYLLRPRGGVLFRDLGPAAPIDAAALRLRRALTDPSRDPAAPARDLEAMVLSPFGPELAGARRLLISPDGVLGLIPFEALQDDAGRYLVERHAISYLTSGRELVRLRAKASAAPRGAPVILADPAFGPMTASGPPDGRRSAEVRDIFFPLLPETAAEAREIQRHLPGARVLVGEGATEGVVKALRAPEVLHVATHGFFLPRERRDPTELTGAADDPEVARAAELQVENRLLRSGLALAGANQRRSGDEDGLLTALEASGLDLHGTKLVVLSACETGVGEVTRGEGVSGLRRALALAGAETQVMSLWRVDDEATRRLMSGYYGALAAGVGRGDALREVALAIRAEAGTAHPYYWAGFIASGSWATLDGQWPRPRPIPALAAARVQPGARGCACGVAGEREGGREGRGEGTEAVLAALIAAGLRRRPRRARMSR